MHKIIKIVVGLCLFISMVWGQMAMAEYSAEEIAELRQKAEQGDAEAQHNLGWAYLDGDGVAKNTVAGVKWFREAAEQGIARAQYFLDDI